MKAVVIIAISIMFLNGANQPQKTDAVNYILKKFEGHSLVAMGEAHGLIQQHDFLHELISDPRFAEIGNVIVEFGNGRYQEEVDKIK